MLSLAFFIACPFCNSPTGSEVRAGIFDGDFWATLLALSAPFALLGAALAIYSRTKSRT